MDGIKRNQRLIYLLPLVLFSFFFIPQGVAAPVSETYKCHSVGRGVGMSCGMAFFKHGLSIAKIKAICRPIGEAHYTECANSITEIKMRCYRKCMGQGDDQCKSASYSQLKACASAEGEECIGTGTNVFQQCASNLALACKAQCQ